MTINSISITYFVRLEALSDRMAGNVKIKKSNVIKIVLISILLVLSGVFILNSYNQNKTSSHSLQETYNSLSATGKRLYYIQSNELQQEVDPRLVYLDNLTITCGGTRAAQYASGSNLGGSCIGPSAFLNFDGDGPNLGGQCCGAMKNISKYEKHLSTMKKYAFNPDSPPDHFNVSVALVKKLITYDKDAVLTPEQRAVYNEALSISEEGPCCCKCWHWYVNSALAKEFIANYNFTAEQVAEYWEESDICGD